MARHNNQLTVGGCNMLKRRRKRVGSCVGASSHSLGRLNGMTKKQKDGRGLGLRRLPIDDFPHNNQPKIGVQDGGKYEGEVRLSGSRGGSKIPLLWGCGSQKRDKTLK